MDCNLIPFFQDRNNQCCGNRAYNPKEKICCLGNNLYDQVEVRSATYLPNNAKSKSTSCNIKQVHTKPTGAILFMDVNLCLDHMICKIYVFEYHGGYEAKVHNNDIAQLNNHGHWLN